MGTLVFAMTLLRITASRSVHVLDYTTNKSDDLVVTEQDRMANIGRYCVTIATPTSQRGKIIPLKNAAGL